MLLSCMKPEKPRSKRIALTASDHLVFVETDKIIYCESDSNYTIFFLSDGQKIIVSKPWKTWKKFWTAATFQNSCELPDQHEARNEIHAGRWRVCGDGINQHITVSRKKKDDFFDMFFSKIWWGSLPKM